MDADYLLTPGRASNYVTFSERVEKVEVSINNRPVKENSYEDAKDNYESENFRYVGGVWSGSFEISEEGPLKENMEIQRHRPGDYASLTTTPMPGHGMSGHHTKTAATTEEVPLWMKPDEYLCELGPHPQPPHRLRYRRSGPSLHRWTSTGCFSSPTTIS